MVRVSKFHLIQILLILTILSIGIGITNVGAEHEEDEEEEGEFGEELGIGALGFLGVGAVYIFASRLNIYLKSREREESSTEENSKPEENNKTEPIQSEKKEEWKTIYQALFKRFRKPLLYTHNVSMFLATVVASVHGVLLLESAEGGELISGAIALILMVLLSILGSIIFFKFRPVWTHRGTRKLTRFLHRQLVLSVLMIIALAIHME